MTTLAATTVMIEGFGRQAAPSANPRYNPAFLSGDGILGWFGRTAVVKGLIARKAERDLRRAILRLSKTSPALLADIGLGDSAPVASGMPQWARPPVALRPSQRAAIALPERTLAPGVASHPVRAARREMRAIQ
jgi:hypothetical protein